ncbi:hypothetical protein SRABI133_02818 [Peribacillus simplex]|uniref:Uncharacterized protein n=1 Tax=Peribacillus simplex TaxID=1478 RepID=A0A9W4L301_9BACI|nr:hypothetical protein SRABI133_02818 [Peribacillus simplex]
MDDLFSPFLILFQSMAWICCISSSFYFSKLQNEPSVKTHWLKCSGIVFGAALTGHRRINPTEKRIVSILLLLDHIYIINSIEVYFKINLFKEILPTVLKQAKMTNNYIICHLPIPNVLSKKILLPRCASLINSRVRLQMKSRIFSGLLHKSTWMKCNCAWLHFTSIISVRINLTYWRS